MNYDQWFTINSIDPSYYEHLKIAWEAGVNSQKKPKRKSDTLYDIIVKIGNLGSNSLLLESYQELLVRQVKTPDDPIIEEALKASIFYLNLRKIPFDKKVTEKKKIKNGKK